VTEGVEEDALPLDVETGSEEETATLGRRLAALLSPGEALLVEGPLGSGKTVLCRAAAEALGVDPRAVRSPSFNVLLEYRGRVPVRHADLYRLVSEEEAVEAGVEEALWSGEAVTLLEWSERLGALPRPPGVQVVIEPLGGDRRRIRARRTPPDRPPAES